MPEQPQPPHKQAQETPPETTGQVETSVRVKRGSPSSGLGTLFISVGIVLGLLVVAVGACASG